MRSQQTSFQLKHIAIAVLFIVSAASGLSAQTAAGPESILGRVLLPGRSVWITDTTGQEEKVRIVGASGAVVTIATSGGIRSLRTSDVIRVRARQSDSLLNGALIGAGVTLGSGLLLCGLMEGGEVCLRNAESWLPFAALGAGIGIGIDALIRPRRTIYDAREGAPQLQVTPLVGPNAAGLRVSVTF